MSATKQLFGLRSLTSVFSLQLSALLIFLTAARGQSLDVSGISTKTAYNNSATFTVQSLAGHDYLALLDGSPVSVGVPVTVTRVDYHELQVFRTNQTTLAVTNRVIQFIVRSSERGDTENGLPPWTPYPTIPSAPSEFAGAGLEILLPQSFPAGYEIPVVAWIRNSFGQTIRVNGALNGDGHPSIDLKRGVGSGFLAGTHAPGPLLYSPSVQTLESSHLINVESNVTWTLVGGTLNGANVWPAHARIAVTNHLTIPAGSSLTINAGTVIRVNPLTDINVNGQVFINGATNDPVIFMPISRAQPWGGFLLQANSSQVTASGAIFTGSGAVPNWFGTNGRPDSHRKEQALFYCTNAPTLTLTDCAAISLAGQLGHSVNGGAITLTRFLMQRTTSGGEFTGASFNVNDSAFIECPDDSAGFVDGDNDGLYIVNGTHGFTNTLFGWTKDDGIDSGASGSGLLNFQSCWFESIFHEANSLSGTGKIVNHYDGVFINCGQGLEAGYSGPIGTLARSLATGNLVGGRFGDNYLSQSYSGFLRATNSFLIYNYRDVWGMNFQDWTYRTSAMNVHSNYLGTPNPYHPSNFVWQATVDGWRLAALMTTPPDAPVGVGLAIRARQFDLNAVTNGVPVRLSSFTTNTVSVDYSVENPGSTLASGTLAFPAGETVQWIPGAPVLGNGPIRVRLSNPAGAAITGIDAAYFMQAEGPLTTALISTGSVWRYLDTGENAGIAWRAVEFDDQSWLAGPAELGYGDGDEATVVRSNGVNGRIITTYFRRAFEIVNPGAYSGLTVSLRRDDGGVVYLNGTEVFRSNMTNAPGIPITFTNFAGNSIGSETAFFSTNLTAALLQPGTNVVAVEIHQNSITSTDVSFELRLDATFLPPLQHLRFGPDWLLFTTSPTAILESAPDLTGPWTQFPQSSPWPVQFTAPQQFYRLRE